MNKEQEQEIRRHLKGISDVLDAVAADDAMRDALPSSVLTPSWREILPGPVAVCVGHSRIGDRGAASVDGTFEWIYNGPVCEDTVAKLEEMGIPTKLFDDYPRPTYSGAMVWLAAELRRLKCPLVIEQHFNSFDGASQEEYLYWHTSIKGKRLAECLILAHGRHDPNPATRGIKPRSGDRGAGFLSDTPCPAVICEPFFGSSPSDWAFWKNHQELLATINAEGIRDYLAEEYDVPI